MQSRKVRVLGIVTALTLLITASTRAATYTFDSLTPGANLAGQDNWQIRSGTPATSAVVTAGSGIDTTLVAESAVGTDDQMTRANDANFAFLPFAGTETHAQAQFDAYMGAVSGAGNYEAAFGLGGASIVFDFGAEGGPGPGGNFFHIQGAFGDDTAPLTSDIHAGDWVRFLLTMDFMANGGDGAGSLSYTDLTTGSALTPVAGLQNVNLKLSVAPAGSGPANWDTMFIRVSNFQQSGRNMAVDNLIPHVSAVPEPGAAAALALLVPTLLRRGRY